MISIQHVQKAIIDRLKANAPLVAAVGVEIRESSWQGTEFTYPNIRVGMVKIPSLMEGSCVDRHGVASWSVLVNSEDASSLEADQIGGLVMQALLDHQLVSTEFSSGWIRLGPNGQKACTRTPQDTWKGEVEFVCNIYANS